MRWLRQSRDLKSFHVNPLIASLMLLAIGLMPASSAGASKRLLQVAVQDSIQPGRESIACVTSVQRLSLRSGPSIRYRRIGVMQRGGQFQVDCRSSDGSWLHGTTGEASGWAASAFLNCGSVDEVARLASTGCPAVAVGVPGRIEPSTPPTVVWLRSTARTSERGEVLGVESDASANVHPIGPNETIQPSATSAPPTRPPTPQEPPDVPPEVPTAHLPEEPPVPPPPADDDDRDADDRERYAPALGYIKGVAFIDESGDGQLDEADPGLNDVEVYLDGGGLQLRQITPGNGSFSFDGLGAGMYDVYIKPGPEWRVTTTSRYAVELSEGDIIMGADFGLLGIDSVPIPASTSTHRDMPLSLPATGALSSSFGIAGSATVVLLVLVGLGIVTERRFKK